MIHEIFPDSMDKNREMAEMKHKTISAADMVLCVSESTKRDLLERYSLPEERVRVTHLAAEFNANTEDGNEPIPSRPFFLYVGARYSYKNFSALIAAISALIPEFPDILLAVVGPPFSPSEKKSITDRKLDSHIFNLEYVSDSHLAGLYKNCIAFVYPSLYEGFGIPPLEAMLCEAPVIASNTSSIPEVVGDAGLLFDPYSVPDLVDRLIFVLNNPAERDRLISKGLAQSKKFSWDNTIARTIEAYQSIAG
jgi:glycosyltransferase involved in cell wall biosynthesis